MPLQTVRFTNFILYLSSVPPHFPPIKAAGAVEKGSSRAARKWKRDMNELLISCEGQMNMLS